MMLPRDPGALEARYGLSAEQAAAVTRRGQLVVVSAGAGTGKTTTMAARYVDTALLLAERESAREPERALRPRRILERIAAVTFTELAAGELRARIARVFRETAETLGPWPRLQSFVLEASRLDGDLPIGTIHSLCGRILRASPFTGSAGPDFVILDQLDRGLLWEQCVTRILDGLAASDPELVARLLAGRDRTRSTRKTVSDLVKVLEPEVLEVWSRRSLVSLAALAEQEAQALLTEAAQRPEHREAIEGAEAVRADLTARLGQTFERALDVALIWARGVGSASLARERPPSFGITPKRLEKVDPSHQALLEAFGEAVAALKRLGDKVAKALTPEALAAEHQWTRDVLVLAAAAGRAFEEDKARRGALDFDDLEHRALTALMSTEVPPSAVSYDEILVDEFQDTSSRQVGILKRLVGDELERVFAVGDAKQSIYRFRYADVAVFNQVARRAPGGAVPLTLNRRSSASVLAVVNAVFGELFPAVPPPETPWVAPMQRLAADRDDPAAAGLPPLILAPWRLDGNGAPPLTAERRRTLDAVVTARAVSRVLERAESHGPMSVGVLLRAVKGNRRAYVDALAAEGIPASVEAGGTFTRDPSAAAGIALLRALALITHEAAWASVLRGSLVGLGDEVVSQLCADRDRHWPDRLKAWLVEAPVLLGESRGVVRVLAEQTESLCPLSVRAQAVIDAAGLQSRQLDKMLGQVRDLEARGLGPMEVLDWFEALVADDKERRVADPAPQGGAVRALTVHASKGLEFDVAVVPQLGESLVRVGYQPPDVVALEEGDLRLSLQVPDGPAPVLRLAHAHLERQREQAEQTRLLYVALTRARDHLVLPLPMDALAPGTAAHAVRGLLRGVDLETEGEARWRLSDGSTVRVEVWPSILDAEAEVSPPELREPLREPLARRAAVVGPTSWSVTRLASLAFCPAYFAQSPVAPWPRPVRMDLYPDPPPVVDGGVVPAKNRGTVVHRWLEGVESPEDIATAPVPAGLEEEIQELRARMETLVKRPGLGPAFTRGPGLHHELALAMEYGGVPMAGAIDRLVLTPTEGGQLRALVVDFKTGATGYPGAGGRNPGYLAAYRFQLAAYAVMLRGLLGDRLAEPLNTALVFVDLEAVEFETWTHAAAEAEVARVLACLENPEQSAPNHQACPGCRMRDFCVARAT